MTSPAAPPSEPPVTATFAPPRNFPFPIWLVPVLYFALACLFLWRSNVGEVFLPAGLLKHVAPYNAGVSTDSLPAWNPLRWDGIAQFYPWRLFAANSLHNGTIPLWNPYQFCGTPFVANSQSAVLYPGNLLFYLMPVAQAFHWSAVLHLTLAGWFTFLLLVHLKRHPVAAFAGGLIFAFSAWQVQWLQLPTFLATSCWLPLTLRQIAILMESSKPFSKFPLLSVSVGVMLLAGHLQIAFYCLLAILLFALFFLLAPIAQAPKRSKLPQHLACGFALIVGMMFALPQILPALELSRVSHRAGKPTAEGYSAYSEYALPSAGLLTLFLPNFYGNDYDPNNIYWGFYTKNVSDEMQIAIRHNAAETANFVGVAALILAFLAFLPHPPTPSPKHVWAEGETQAESSPQNWGVRGADEGAFFAFLALLSLLMALGTPVNRLFYFFVPGFGQSGSPARSLVLWALSLAVLAGYGLHSLIVAPPTKRQIQIALGSVVLVFAVCLSVAAQRLKTPPQGMPIPILGEVFGRIGLDATRLAVVFIAAALLLMVKQGREKNSLLPAYGFGILILLELFSVGMPVNPTAKPEEVYPETAGIKLLKEQTGHERIAPINQGWSLYQSPPAVLPPNAGMVYGLRDVQGYDSLLTRQYKEFANKSALPNRMGTVDASPPEVGNMVFFQNPASPYLRAAGVKFVVMRADSPAALPAVGALVSTSESAMQVYALPKIAGRAAISAGTVEWKNDTPTQVTLSVNASQDGTKLTVADQWYPGWKAFVDGKELPVERDAETGVFRQIKVPAGAHTVTFRYAPTTFRLGVYLACAALMLCVSGAVAARRRNG